MQLFFSQKKPKNAPKDAIVNLRDTLQMLEKRENHLQNKIDAEQKTARANATTNKRGMKCISFFHLFKERNTIMNCS